jgi:hypothetical protein
MSNELTIPPVRTTATTTDAPKAPPTRPARVEPPAAAAKPYVNPSLRLDAELGLVVIEFRGEDGALTATIPSERQIQAYRVHQEPRQREVTREAPSEAPAETRAEVPAEAARETLRRPERDGPRDPQGESTDQPHRNTGARAEPARAEAPERHDVPRAEAREARPPPREPESRPA